MAEKPLLELVVQETLPVEFDDPVRNVFEFWKALLGHERSQLGPKRRAVIERAMEIGYSVDDLRLAIVGCKADGFSQGQNDRHTTFDDIELICRDEGKIDRFLKIGEAKVRALIAKDKEQQAAAQAAPAVTMPAPVRAKLDQLFGKFKKRAT